MAGLESATINQPQGEGSPARQSRAKLRLVEHNHNVSATNEIALRFNREPTTLERLGLIAIINDALESNA